uniref:PH domain-containing protein n=1 Tax=Plectus sambesii TaxID=2011161 RepID=A0A914UT17_9BILA
MAARVDLGSKTSLLDMSIHHGTPRSVKHRDRLAKEEGPRRAMSDVPLNGARDILLALDAERSRPQKDNDTAVDSELEQTNKSAPRIDTSSMHTLRKGWLMLRGRSDQEWMKHWVVLAGLSLKLFKDVWAEDTGEPVLEIDLGECDNVYPSASARNYGIEIRCHRSRYVLSAMTPGIRDSWIAAMQQNLHNPSPTYAETCASTEVGSLSDANCAELVPPPRKKRIAYVAPESHHISATDASSSDDADVEEEEPVDRRRASREDTSISERSVDSSGAEETVDGERHGRPQRRRRRSSLSPTVRRSPVSRLKERSSSRRQRSPVSLRFATEPNLSPSRQSPLQPAGDGEQRCSPISAQRST